MTNEQIHKDLEKIIEELTALRHEVSILRQEHVLLVGRLPMILRDATVRTLYPRRLPGLQAGGG